MNLKKLPKPKLLTLMTLEQIDKEFLPWTIKSALALLFAFGIYHATRPIMDNLFVGLFVLGSLYIIAAFLFYQMALGIWLVLQYVVLCFKRDWNRQR